MGSVNDLEYEVVAMKASNADLENFTRKLTAHVAKLDLYEDSLEVTFLNMAKVKVTFNKFSSYSSTFHFEDLSEGYVKPELLSFQEKTTNNMSLDRVLFILGQYCYPDGWYNENANAITKKLFEK